MVTKIRYNRKLFIDGEFRIARDNVGGMVIQHYHPNYLVPGVNDDYGWSYCWFRNHECIICKAKVPEQLVGFYNLLEWNK